MDRRWCFVLAAACSLGGCGYSHNRAAPHAAIVIDAPPPTPRWPTTWTGELPTTTAVVRGLTLRPESGSSQDAVAAPDLRLSHEVVATPVGSGLITHNRYATSDGVALPLEERSFEYFAWRERPAALDALRTEPGGKTEAASLWALTASAPFRMEFRLWLPEDRPARGVVLYQWGLSGYRYEKSLVESLVARGWAVLGHNGLSWKRPGALTVTPEVPGGGPPKPAERIAVARRTDESGRMDAQTRQTYLDAAAALAAADFDDAVGQYALANETALRFVMQTHPAIPERPLVIVGCSFGAIMSPTVAARLTESGLRPEAVVLIGGGTNFLKLAGSSWMDYYYSRVRGLAAAELHLTVNERKIVTAGYLERSTLDPYHTAPELRDEKVLILHASMDDIVPASTGDDLWDRAGRPERWIGNFGHLFMFAALPWKVDDIADWLDRAVAETDSHSDGRGDEP